MNKPYRVIDAMVKVAKKDKGLPIISIDTMKIYGEELYIDVEIEGVDKKYLDEFVKDLKAGKIVEYIFAIRDKDAEFGAIGIGNTEEGMELAFYCFKNGIEDVTIPRDYESLIEYCEKCEERKECPIPAFEVELGGIEEVKKALEEINKGVMENE